MNDVDTIRVATGVPAPRLRGDHLRLTNAGWSYRTNEDRGWIVYKNPGTGRWYTRRDALAVLDEGNPGLAAAGMIG